MTLRINGSSSGYTEVDAPAVAGNNTLLLPGNNGSNRQSMITDGAGNLSFAWDAGSLLYRLNSQVNGSNVSTVQSVFGVGVTLASSTVYAFDALYIFLKAVGATSHTVNALFGGTATINNILWSGSGTVSTAAGGLPLSVSSGTQAILTIMSNSATTSLAATPSIANAVAAVSVQLRGTVSINAGGTFIPQYQLSAAPGGAYGTAVGSYIRFMPIGAAGSNSSQGTWA
jgi:hypothetical protein